MSKIHISLVEFWAGNPGPVSYSEVQHRKHLCNPSGTNKLSAMILEFTVDLLLLLPFSLEQQALELFFPKKQYKTKEATGSSIDRTNLNRQMDDVSQNPSVPCAAFRGFEDTPELSCSAFLSLDTTF